MDFSKFRWLIFFVPFVFLFFRSDLPGIDSYAYALQICGMKTTNPAGFFVFSWLPCNILVWKTLLLGLYAGFVGSSALLVRLFNKKRVFEVLLVFLGLSPLVLFTFFKFENEVFALPLIMLASFFFYRGIKQKEGMVKPKNFLIAIILTIISGFIWEGTYFFALALGFAFLPLFVLAVSIGPFVQKKLLESLQSLPVVESWFGGISPLWLFVFVVPFGLLAGWSVGVPLLVGLGFGFLNPKLLIIILPFLLVGCVRFLEWVENHVMLEQGVLVICFVGLIGFGFCCLFLPPTQLDWDWVDSGIGLSNELGVDLNNDWSPGYWLNWRGYDTNIFGGGSDPDYEKVFRPFVAVTGQELDCVLVDDFSSFFVNRRVYHCSAFCVGVYNGFHT